MSTRRGMPSAPVPLARKRLAAAAGAAALAILAGRGLVGCSSDPDSITAQAQSGDRKGYLSQDGQVQTIRAAQRAAPLQLSGTTLSGRPWSVADERGRVVVLNVWGSWCPPCVAEAPDLQRAYARLTGGTGTGTGGAGASDSSAAAAKVVFMGVDIRESRANGAAFLRSHGIGYPSLSDEDGVALLALRGYVQSPPTTIVLDPQGRVAARVLGPVDAGTLTGLVQDVRDGAAQT